MFCECLYKACPTFFYPKVNECTIKKKEGTEGATENMWKISRIIKEKTTENDKRSQCAIMHCF